MHIIIKEKGVETIKSEITIETPQTPKNGNVEMNPKFNPIFLLKNGKEEACNLKSRAFLLEKPRGAYTACRTVSGDMIFQLKFHVHRLATSIDLMIEKDPVLDNDIKKIMVPLCDPKKLYNIVVENFKLAIESFWKKKKKEIDINYNNDNYNKDNQNNYINELISKQDLKLTILFIWGQPHHSIDNPYDIYTHIQLLPKRPKKPIKVIFREIIRKYARAKDSKWIHETKQIEDTIPNDVNEVLLVNQDGSILEGMSSNFFIVKDGKVYTAADNVLCGTVRGLVLDVCKKAKIEVVFTPPNVSNYKNWSSCFITSTSRLVCPIGQVINEVKPIDKEPYVFDTDPLLNRIKKLVETNIKNNSTLVWEQ